MVRHAVYYVCLFHVKLHDGPLVKISNNNYNVNFM